MPCSLLGFSSGCKALATHEAALSAGRAAMLEGEGSIKAEQLASAVDQRDGGDSSDAAAVAGELSAEAAIEADLKPTKAAGAAAAAISLAGGSRTEAAKLAAGVAGRAALEEGLPPTAAAEAAVRATQEVKRPESQAAFAADVGHSVASVYATAGAAPEVAAKAAEEAVRGSGGDRRQAALLGGQAASAAALSRGEELADLGRDVLKSALLTGATNAEAGELADAAQDAAVASRGIRSAQQLEDGRAAVDAMLVSDGTPTQHNHLVQHTRRGQQQQQQQQQLEPITVQSVDTQVMKILKQAGPADSVFVSRRLLHLRQGRSRDRLLLEVNRQYLNVPGRVIRS
eukprot:TRINITY_DN13576_c1_g1_i6.p1 TRINITY_DN13576_c1_g1~~TRINITY_DN13576_c1_g1_i6.p1  ORF type:complete len:343 (-),score=109.48 TRINITY_DN13576_c1_g1_i6:107-1135(-)